MTTAPRVTVLMSVFNGEAFLAEALESIFGQTFGEFELLVIDDASTDSSAAILGSYNDPRLRVVRNERNLGLTKSLNVGLREARGEYVARQDADDVSHPTRLAEQVALLDARPDMVLVGSELRFMIHGRPAKTNPFWGRMSDPLALHWQLSFENPFGHSAVMYRRDAVLEAGAYDESFRTSQDYELWSRLLRRYDATNILHPLVDLRTHAASISSRYNRDTLANVRLLAQRNLEEWIGIERVAELADFWVTVSNVHVYGEVPDVDRGLELLDEAWLAFVARHPEAANHRELAVQRSRMLARTATMLAEVDRRAALRAYLRALRIRFGVICKTFPRFAALFLLGGRKRALKAAFAAQAKR